MPRLAKRNGASCFLFGLQIYSKTMVVRMRHTRSHTKNRRSHHKVANMRISTDESGTPHVRHRMNPVTGKYRGRIVIDMSSVTAKKAVKEKAKVKSA